MDAVRYPCALTIAGSDSSGGAGLQADLKTFAALGVYGASVVTAVTAQNTAGVRALHPLPVEIIAAQIDAVLEDLPVGAVKIGMMANEAIIHTVTERLRAHSVPAIVLDPVMTSSSGYPCWSLPPYRRCLADLLPMATIITPNLPEAAIILNKTNVCNTGEAAEEILKLGVGGVLIKGGHGVGETLEDLLLTAEAPHPIRFQHPRSQTPHTHGTGCSLSAAIAAGLARGLSLPEATEAAIAWLQGAIANAWPLGAGHGPVHHFWQFWPPGY